MLHLPRTSAPRCLQLPLVPAGSLDGRDLCYDSEDLRYSGSPVHKNVLGQAFKS